MAAASSTRPIRSKRPRNADLSRSRVWSAAAAEFAARGFDGAKVDRIAAKARVNKAMIYYHFKSKAGLYSAVLQETFAAVAQAVGQVRAAGGPAEVQVAAYVAAIAGVASERPYFPQIWLREVAEGGTRVDNVIAGYALEVLTFLGGMLADGVAEGRMRQANPFFVQLSVVGPLTLFLASQPLRARVGQLPGGPTLPVGAMVEHLQEMVLGALLTTDK